MSYELIENITSADIAVRVKALSLSLLFRYGAEALISELMEDISLVRNTISVEGSLDGADLSLLYFEFLNEILFYKDSEGLLLVPDEVAVSDTGGLYTCRYRFRGEKIDKKIHKFKTDIKAVTLHGMKIYKADGFFFSESVFDV